MSFGAKHFQKNNQMNKPITIESAECTIVRHYLDSHLARRHAYLNLGEKLAHIIANKAFLEPTIIRAGWIEQTDWPTNDIRVRCSIATMSFKDWAIENLRTGQEHEFGTILEIPLSRERMALLRDSFLYVK